MSLIVSVVFRAQTALGTTASVCVLLTVNLFCLNLNYIFEKNGWQFDLRVPFTGGLKGISWT